MKKIHFYFFFILILSSCNKDKVHQTDPNACHDEMFNNKNDFKACWNYIICEKL